MQRRARGLTMVETATRTRNTATLPLSIGWRPSPTRRHTPLLPSLPHSTACTRSQRVLRSPSSRTWARPARRSRARSRTCLTGGRTARWRATRTRAASVRPSQEVRSRRRRSRERTASPCTIPAYTAELARPTCMCIFCPARVEFGGVSVHASPLRKRFEPSPFPTPAWLPRVSVAVYSSEWAHARICGDRWSPIVPVLPRAPSSYSGQRGDDDTRTVALGAAQSSRRRRQRQ